jgi:hypothetical protein
MSLHKHVVRNWSMSLVLLMAPLARADKKPSSSPPPKPAAAPAAHPPANANANAIRSQHPTTSAPGTKFGTHTTPTRFLEPIPARAAAAIPVSGARRLPGCKTAQR